jgi:hypothetical protein
MAMPDFASMTSPDQSGRNTAVIETARLAVLIEQERATGTTYTRYRAAIDIESLDLDAAAGTASAEVSETDSAQTNVSPDIESKSLFHHVVTLRKTDGVWKVAADEYRDEIKDYVAMSGKSLAEMIDGLHRQVAERDTARKDALAAAGVSDESTNAQVSALFQAGYSRAEIERTVIAPLAEKLQRNGGAASAQGLNVTPLARIYHPLNAANAVAYAHRWAYHVRNPAFADFRGLGGDCTNFVSQVILAGGAPMERTGNWIWFYDAMNPAPGYPGARRSASWSGVNELYSFLTTNPPILGPVGRPTSLYSLLPGDVVQLQNDPGNRWGHSAVVVSATWKPVWYWSWWPVGWQMTWTYEVLIACHEEDKDNFNLNGWSIYPQRYLNMSYYN